MSIEKNLIEFINNERKKITECLLNEISYANTWYYEGYLDGLDIIMKNILENKKDP